MINNIQFKYILLIIIFLIFILLPFFGGLLQVKGEGEALQNRRLNQLPEINIDSIRSGLFGKKFNEYVWDHLPLRSQLITVDHWIDYYVFRDSPVPDKVLLGRDGWLFLYSAVMEWPRENAEQVDFFVKLALDATGLQKKCGKQIFIVPSPNKASIYPEFLLDDNRSQYLHYSSIYRERLQAAASAGAQSLLLLWEPFVLEKEKLLNGSELNKQFPDRLCYLFRPRDRHFSWETSLLQAQKVAEAIAPGKWNNSYYGAYFSEYKIEKSEMAKLYIKINLPEPYVTFDEIQYLNDLSIIKTDIPVEKTNGRIISFKINSSNGQNNFLPKRIVVIHDSFFDQSRFFLAPYFQESVFMNWNVMRNMPVFMNEIRKADILVIQSVEGHWSWRYPQLKYILDDLAKGSNQG
jgi:hypothetical protein